MNGIAHLIEQLDKRIAQHKPPSNELGKVIQVTPKVRVQLSSHSEGQYIENPVVLGSKPKLNSTVVTSWINDGHDVAILGGGSGFLADWEEDNLKLFARLANPPLGYISPEAPPYGVAGNRYLLRFDPSFAGSGYRDSLYEALESVDGAGLIAAHSNTLKNKSFGVSGYGNAAQICDTSWRLGNLYDSSDGVFAVGVNDTVSASGLVGGAGMGFSRVVSFDYYAYGLGVGEADARYLTTGAGWNSDSGQPLLWLSAGVYGDPRFAIGESSINIRNYAYLAGYDYPSVVLADATKATLKFGYYAAGLPGPISLAGPTFETTLTNATFTIFGSLYGDPGGPYFINRLVHGILDDSGAEFLGFMGAAGGVYDALPMYGLDLLDDIRKALSSVYFGLTQLGLARYA